jgi:hypothetical protein
MNYSKETMQIDHKLFPHAYYISRYLDYNRRLNEGKKRENTITLRTLVGRCPHLPSYDKVMATDRHVYKRIIEPMIENIEEIPRLFPKWLDKDGKEIENPRGFFKGARGYDKFINSKLLVDYTEYPQHPERLKKKKQHDRRNKPRTPLRVMPPPNAFENQDKWPEDIRLYLADKEEICIKEIEYDCLGFDDKHKPTRQDDRCVGSILKREDWKQLQRKHTPKFGLQRMWRK